MSTIIELIGHERKEIEARKEGRIQKNQGAIPYLIFLDRAVWLLVKNTGTLKLSLVTHSEDPVI